MFISPRGAYYGPDTDRLTFTAPAQSFVIVSYQRQ